MNEANDTLPGATAGTVSTAGGAQPSATDKPVFNEIRPGLYTEDRNGVDIWIDPAAMIRAGGNEPTQEACAAVFAGISRAYAQNGINAILVQNPDLESIDKVVARMRATGTDNSNPAVQF